MKATSITTGAAETAEEGGSRARHSHSHGCCSGTSAPVKRGDVPEPSATALLWTRAGLLALIALVLYVTISFCTGVYFDREAAFHGALLCSDKVLAEAGVPHWLQNGTLLGATRLGRLVLWDADLDFGILAGSQAELDAVSERLDERCFGYRSNERRGAVNTNLRVLHKCTHRLCAEFHETVLVSHGASEGDTIVTGDGESPAKELFPLTPCRVADVETTCPRNAPYFLAQAYGSEWLSKPLTKLF